MVCMRTGSTVDYDKSSSGELIVFGVRVPAWAYGCNFLSVLIAKSCCVYSMCITHVSNAVLYYLVGAVVYALFTFQAVPLLIWSVCGQVSQ